MESGPANVPGSSRDPKSADRAQDLTRQIIDALPVLIACIDANRRYRFTNAAFREWFGVTPEEMKGRHMRDFLGEQAYAIAEPYIDRVLSGGRVSWDSDVTYPQGGHRYVHVDYVPEFDNKRDVAGFFALVTDLTDRRREEAERAYLAAIVDSSQDYIISKTLDGTITSWNKGAEQTFGYTAEEAIGCPVSIIIPEGHSDEMVAILDRIRAGEQVQSMETERVAKDGRAFPVSITVSPIKDDKGEIVGASAIGSDVSQRNENERKLRENENRLRLALRAGKLGAWDWHFPTGRVIWSPQVEAIHGVAAESFEGTFDAFKRMVYPDDIDKVLSTVQRCVDERSAYHVEYRVVRPDGRVTWVEASGELLLDEAGRPDRLIGVCADVSERRRANERFRLAVEASPSAVVLADAAGAIHLVNSRTKELFGYSAEELLGKPVETLVPPRLRKRHAAYRELYLKNPKMRPMGDGQMLWGRRKDGSTFRTEVSLNAFQTDDGPMVLTTIMDISERERTRKALEQANRRLAEKNREMEDFVYTVSHDLKSPVVTMVGFIELLKSDLAEGNVEAVRDAAGRIEGAANRMGALISDLLQFSRLGRVEEKLEIVDAASIIDQLRTELAPRLGEAGAAIEVHGPLPPVKAAPVRLAEVFENLLTNAIKYGCPQPGGRIEVGGMRRRRQVHYFVRDHGPGIAKEYQKKVFGLFQRLQAEGEGTGVGLAAVAKTVQAMSGRVWVESKPGEGATFWLSFPALTKS